MLATLLDRTDSSPEHFVNKIVAQKIHYFDFYYVIVKNR